MIYGVGDVAAAGGPGTGAVSKGFRPMSVGREVGEHDPVISAVIQCGRNAELGIIGNWEKRNGEIVHLNSRHWSVKWDWKP